MDIKFYNLNYFPVFLIAIIVAVLLGYCLVKRLKELNFYGALSKNPQYNFAFRERVLLYKSIICFIGFLLLCIVILRPLWGDKKSEIFGKDRDVIFVLDISKSMLAQDIKPNRLENAKNSIENALPYLFGAKVALVSFAGSSEIRCPLSDDYDFFSECLKNCVPENAALGGSYLNSALEKVVDKVLNKDRATKQNIIVISDGGDFITKDIDGIAKEIKDLGAKLTIIGVGDTIYESNIPLKDGSFLSYKDEYVKTKLENEFLKDVAFKAGGNYVEIGIKSLSISDILSILISSDTLKVVENKSLDEYEDRFQIFLFFAIIAFLIWAYPIGYDKKKAVLKCLIFMFALNIYGGQGEELFLAKDYENAKEIFRQEAEKNPKNLIARYNYARSLYAIKEYDIAYYNYESVLSLAMENEDAIIQDRVTYDMAVVACIYAQNLLDTDIRRADYMARKSMDLFRELLINASTNDKIPDAFLYHRKVIKSVETALKELEDTQAKMEEIKKEFVKEIEELIILEDKILNLTSQDNFQEGEVFQNSSIKRTEKLLENIAIHSKDIESQVIELKAFVAIMQELESFVKKAHTSEKESLKSSLEKNKSKTVTHAQEAIIYLSEALTLIKDSSNSSESTSSSESGEEYEEEESEEYDEESEGDYSDSEASENDLNEGTSMTSLPSPEQLEGKILQSEKENNMRRDQTRGKYQKVEKDW